MACFVQIIDFLPLAFSPLSSCSPSSLPPVASASSLSLSPHPSGCFLFSETVGRARNRNRSSSLTRPDLSPRCLNTVPGLPGRGRGEDLMEMFCSQVSEPSQSVSQSIYVSMWQSNSHLLSQLANSLSCQKVTRPLFSMQSVAVFSVLATAACNVLIFQHIVSSLCSN